MKYPKSTATGDAGEYFFAYQITRTLGWPCRLFDIDIGIDAQVEILDVDRNSTGKFAAFQIKATEEGKKISYRYVSKEQLRYWREMETPVFAVLVDLQNRSMFLHKIKQQHTYHETEDGSIRIDFDRTAERFNINSAKVIKAATEEAALIAIKSHLDVVLKGITAIKDAINSPNMDPNELIDLMRRRSGYQSELIRAQTLVFKTGLGSDGFEQIDDDFNDAISRLRDCMEHWEMAQDWDDDKHGDGEIKKFIAEGR